MTIERLREIKPYLSLRNTCLYCGRTTVLVEYAGSYVVKCPKWNTFLGYVKGDGFYHSNQHTNIPIWDDETGWTV
jgi:hypothetical protein